MLKFSKDSRETVKLLGFDAIAVGETFFTHDGEQFDTDTHYLYIKVDQNNIVVLNSNYSGHKNCILLSAKEELEEDANLVVIDLEITPIN